MEPYVKRDQPRRVLRALRPHRDGRAASSIGIGTALIASGYDNIMNYLQALFSIFNAPLFATFIIGMFWKRMTPAAGFWGLVAGTLARRWRPTRLQVRAGSPSAPTWTSRFWGASAAFVVDAIVTVGVTLFTQPKPVEELQGLVYGMANVDESAPKADSAWDRQQLLGLQRARHGRRPDHHLLVGARPWLTRTGATTS